MLERMLIEHCAPTLAGLKAACLLRCSAGETLHQQAVRWDGMLRTKGVRVTVLRERDGSALLCVYREKRLEKELAREEVRTFLRQFGYCGGVKQCLRHLRSRLAQAAFPHEIGVFLGYPLGDVAGFMEHGGKNAKCTGCWKVYCDPCAAQRQFARLKKCKEVYMRQFQQGASVMKLTVGA